MRLQDGREVGVRIIDISISGAALSAAVIPPLGAAVTVGRQSSKVVRHFDGGLAVEFMRGLNIAEFDEFDPALANRRRNLPSAVRPGPSLQLKRLEQALRNVHCAL